MSQNVYLNMARVAYPPSPHIVQNSRELVCQGCIAPPLYGWLALDWRLSAVLFSGGVTGVYPPEPPLSQDWERAGG